MRRVACLNPCSDTNAETKIKSGANVKRYNFIKKYFTEISNSMRIIDQSDLENESDPNSILDILCENIYNVWTINHVILSVNCWSWNFSRCRMWSSQFFEDLLFYNCLLYCFHCTFHQIIRLRPVGMFEITFLGKRVEPERC